VPSAAVLLVFGRGVVHAGGVYTLTPGSAARVQAAVDYVAASGTVARVVFTGGWAEGSQASPPPPVGWREGDLMLARAQAAGLDTRVEMRAENRSRSTLENLLCTVEDGLLVGHDFCVRQPLGIVSHAWHLPRVRFLAGKVLGLRGPALLDVAAAGGERPARWRSEPAARLASRMCFFGVRDPAGLLHRERYLVSSLRHAERLARRR
jgi:hypothetical protein